MMVGYSGGITIAENPRGHMGHTAHNTAHFFGIPAMPGDNPWQENRLIIDKVKRVSRVALERAA
jgi:hypothetical protein